jgi:hypothetical protein
VIIENEGGFETRSMRIGTWNSQAMRTRRSSNRMQIVAELMELLAGRHAQAPGDCALPYRHSAKAFARDPKGIGNAPFQL